MARSLLFRTDPTFFPSGVAVRDLDGASPFTLGVECATHPSTTVNALVSQGATIYITAVPLAVVRLRYINPFAPNVPLSVVVDKNGSDQDRITVNLATDGFGNRISTATQIRAAILQHPQAAKLVLVILGATGTGVITAAVDEFTLGTDPDINTSAPSSGFPATGACTVEIASSIDGPWTVDTAAGAALSTVANGAVKHYYVVDKAIKAVRVTVDTTGTQAVISAVGGRGR